MAFLFHFSFQVAFRSRARPGSGAHGATQGYETMVITMQLSATQCNSRATKSATQLSCATQCNSAELRLSCTLQLRMQLSATQAVGQTCRPCWGLLKPLWVPICEKLRATLPSGRLQYALVCCVRKTKVILGCLECEYCCSYHSLLPLLGVA